MDGIGGRWLPIRRSWMRDEPHVSSVSFDDDVGSTQSIKSIDAGIAVDERRY